MKLKVLLRKKGGAARARAAGAESSFWRPDPSMVHVLSMSIYHSFMLLMTPER